MSETHKERIVKSTAARRMMEAVSPIYEDSYAGCWLFEDIGREWDRLWEIIDELPDQLFPHTATWLLSLWERRYGIVSNETDSIEERRRRIEECETYPKPFIPAVIDRWVNVTSGSRAYVDDNIGPYTFGVYIETQPDSTTVDIDQLRKYINAHKHSHMSYDLAFQASGKVLVGVETGYWRFGYPMTGTASAGQLPQPNVAAGLSDAKVDVLGDAKAYSFPYTMAGTVPDVNTAHSSANASVDVNADAQPYVFSYPAAGDAEAGKVPEYNTLFSGVKAGIDVDAAARPYLFSYPAAGDTEAGEQPEYIMTGSVEQSSIRASPTGEAFGIHYALCGTMNAGAGTL